MEFGPRTSGSSAHAQTVEYISKQLTAAGWTVHQQDVIVTGKEIKNIIATRGNQPVEDKTDWIIMGAHYDSRLMADRDPDEMKRTQPVPSANDGASGVAVLLELARVLPEDMDENVWLAFFDAEDNANISDWRGIMGSQAFVDSLIVVPDAVVIVDMIGDDDLNIFIEKNSDISLVTSIWGTAASLGYAKYFIPFPKYGITDDHTPFLNEGIPAVDIIDFDYAYWHSTQDTIDKVSAKSLQIVGEVMYTWITTRDQ
ncbi:MAG: M28 family peptidase [Anaerolineales bacterium]|nr:M28 family peptidase [Anaerolineales bacterium]